MRYQDWDILLFPEKSMVPLQEFKTSCHIVHDQDALHQRNNVVLLPTVTSFIQALPAGEQFRISIHSWENPEPSRLAQRGSKSLDLVMFEARLLVDGRLVGAKVFGRAGPWPTIINTSLQIDKNGEMEMLRFPVFHRELLAQNYWNAGDDLGRIKVVIAEGYTRDLSSTSLDRIKNVVAFSFQHAPLDILEASAIAWPNAAMWHQVSFNASYLPQCISPQQVIANGVEAHSHSPRPKASTNRPALPPPTLGPMLPPGIPMFSRAGPSDPFMESVHNWRQISADMSMPDYSSVSSWASHSRRTTDPMPNDRPERRYDTLQSAGAFESICEALLPSAPDNTPQNNLSDDISNTVDTNGDDELAEPNSLPSVSKKNEIYKTDPTDPSIKHEDHHKHIVPMLNSSIAGIKGRKENTKLSTGAGEAPGSNERMRRVGQPYVSSNTSGVKRQRVVTPASFKVIDEEDEPRSSPTRKGSLVTPATERERQALSGIEPNII